MAFKRATSKSVWVTVNQSNENERKNGIVYV